MRLRPQPRAPLDGRRFDVVVIGGGINGVAIARECARGRRRTLLVEQNDFAGGTTSRSTRIIHGGLRYLEHAEIGLVRESLRERERLLWEHPHLVRPLQFVLTVPPGGRSAIEVRLGLWLYRKLAGTGRSTAADAAALERTLDRGSDSLRIFNYDDAQCEFPERLVAEWLADALEHGAIARNHTAALEITTANGRVQGVRLRDSLLGTEYRVLTSFVVNATGPWADRLCETAGIRTSAPMIGGVRGSHVVLPRFAGAPSTALYAEAVDGRPMFVIPWNRQVLVGTTEVRDDSDPSRVQPSLGEIEYLVNSLRRLFPRAALPEISHAFAGIRPLPSTPGKPAAAITRRHFLRDHVEEGAAGMISVVGGKLTTAGSLARECARRVGVAVAEPRFMSLADASEIDTAIGNAARDVAFIGGIDIASARSLVSRHGPRALLIAHHMALDDRLRKPLADGRDYLVAEATFAVAREAAVTLADVLLRRVPIALAVNWSHDMASQCARRIGDVLNWSDATVQSELEDFNLERSDFLVTPASRRLAA